MDTKDPSLLMNIFNDSSDATTPSRPRRGRQGRPPVYVTPEQIARPGTESAHQKALFAWAALHKSTYPELELLFSIPNGGQRNLITASRMKAEGARAGVPDIFWPLPRGNFHGLFIEMKIHSPTSRISPLQVKWYELLWAQGYAVTYAYTWEEAVEILKQYYGPKRPTS